MRSIIKVGKSILLKSVKKLALSNEDILELADSLDYPDLVNLICKKEKVEHFSDICLEYLEGVSFSHKVLELAIKQVISKYVNKTTCLNYEEAVQDIYIGILTDSKLINKLDIRNIIKRDAEYRKSVKFYIPEIDSVDSNLLITILVKINREV